MPTKTLYVKDEQLWEKARRLAGNQRFSEVVAQLLAKWVAAKEKEEAMISGKAFTQIKLWVGGTSHWNEHPEDRIEDDHKIAFTGRFLASNDAWHIETKHLNQSPTQQVYQMKNGRLLFYIDWRIGVVPDSESGATYKIFSDYAELSGDPVFLNTMWVGEEGELEGDEREECDWQFQRDIANALGTEPPERIVYID